MGKVIEKIDERKYALIPKSTIYTFLGVVILGVLGSWFSFTTSLARIETRIVVIERDNTTELQNRKENVEKLETLHNDMLEIKNILNLKQDKKFAE